jgi:hypothetical protein
MKSMEVSPYSMGRWAPPGKERHPRWSADRRRSVCVDEQHPLGGQTVEIRRPHKIVTLASNMVLAVLVGHDDENVVAVDCHH